MRIKLLGETHHPKHIRPLNDAKAIDAGANFISETFLFSFAALLSAPTSLHPYPPTHAHTPITFRPAFQLLPNARLSKTAAH